MDEQDKLARFEQSVMPHMDAAYNLARWLASSEPDAQDIVQEAFLRAFKFFGGFRGGDARSWLLRIVRNSFYDSLKRNSKQQTGSAFEEQIESVADDSAGPDEQLVQQADRATVNAAIEALPVEFREILVMRELEALSYKEIADIAELPIGTVMSRLARARSQLRKDLAERLKERAR